MIINIYIPNLLKKCYNLGIEGLDEVEKYIYALIEEDDLKFNYDREQAAAEEMRKVGIQEGIKQNKITMIKAMYQDNTPIEKIAKYAEMSLKEVENILKIS